MTTVELVMESVSTGKQLVVTGGPKIPNGPYMNSGGGDIAPMPPGLAPGKYRLFYRFRKGTQLVGEGHYFETSLPQPLQVYTPMPAIFAPKTRAIRLPWAITTSLIVGLCAMPPLILATWIACARRRRIRFSGGLCIQ